MRAAITQACRRPETEAVAWLLAQADAQADASDAQIQIQAQALARKLVTKVRAQRSNASGVDALMHEFSLSSEEGVALMCLAEALLRIPDSATADRLIADKISKGDWRKHLGGSPSLFVNAATWGLLITEKMVATTDASAAGQGLGSALSKLITKGGEPLIRKGVDLAMRMLGNQFVTGQTILEALKNSRDKEARGYRYSHDMLDEAALTEEDASTYYAAYADAIHAIGRASDGRGIRQGPGISIKLSALHPRYSRAQHARVMQQLLPRIKGLALLAKQYDIGLNIDAEESERLELSLDLIEALAFDGDLVGFEGIGFVVQAYQKRAPLVLDFLFDLAQRSGRKMMVRLVKGAYWDAEIKRAQVDGLAGYPVYTRKIHTDVSFLVCARKLLAQTAFIYPQFATHNAQTLAQIHAWAERDEITDYEFQCLHGMGETLYDQVVGPVCCISPWNFPLAIFTGQIAAALATGNVVLAKPAEQTPLIAYRAVQLLLEAGIPRAALQLLPGPGDVVGAALCQDVRVKGVIFTGSSDVAQAINRTLAQRAADEACDIVLIAETGGQNAMIVDSSALPGQVVQDAIWSAFDSAGQRCSALRVLFLQEEIADQTIAMLKGAMRELCIDNPDRLATDIGPVIDVEAQQKLQSHIASMKTNALRCHTLDLPPETANGTFVAPTLLEIASLAQLKEELFGPVLHVIRYQREALAALIEEINASGYGLTLGIHSRIDQTVALISSRAHVGNIYVNRNMVGAVVGVQPFGGEGKSGTGPKAGGPLYLKRLQRNASMPIQHGKAAPPVLVALQEWAAMHGHQSLATNAEHYMRSSLFGNTLVLNGPTGERNTLTFAARGAVLCIAVTTAALLNQMAAALATGNLVLLPRQAEKLLPPGLPVAVKTTLRWIADLGSHDVPFQVALVETAIAAEIKPLLASRTGVLVSTLDTTADDAITLWRLVTERALCINTTAAGGNASLMMLAL